MKYGLFLLFLLLFIPGGLATEQTLSVQPETLLKSSSSWDGTSLPQYPSGTPEVTLMKFTIAPEAALPVHMHPVINTGYMLEGELTVYKETGETRTIQAGEPLMEVVDQWHYGKNTGSVPAVILVFYAGEKGKPITVLKKEP